MATRPPARKPNPETPNTRTVEHEGVTYVVAAEPLNDLEVLEAWEDQKYVAMCRAILGAEQWATYKNTKRTAVEMLELVTKLVSND